VRPCLMVGHATHCCDDAMDRGHGATALTVIAQA
jgi:hypothetical protein